jgi:hypothetical protein
MRNIVIPLLALVMISIVPLFSIRISLIDHLLAEAQPFEKNIPYIKLNHNNLINDNVNIYVIINQYTEEQSKGFVNDVIRAVEKWSNLLKERSGNYNAWNFNIIWGVGFLTDKGFPNFIQPSMVPNIIIELIGDPLYQCGVLYGGTHRPDVDSFKPIYTMITTSCLIENDEVLVGHRMLYSTVLHEFGHVLGLGHTFNKDNDLMCGDEINYNQEIYHTCVNNFRSEPSNLDINAVLYMYGQDGFIPANRQLNEESYYVER